MSDRKDIQDMYFRSVQKVQKMSRPEIQKLIKKLGLPIARNLKTSELRTKLIDRLKENRDKRLKKVKVESIQLPTLSIKELEQIFADLFPEYIDKLDIFIPNSLTKFEKFVNKNQIMPETRINVFVKLTTISPSTGEHKVKDLISKSITSNNIQRALKSFEAEIEKTLLSYEEILEIDRIDIRFETYRAHTNFKRVALGQEIGIYNPNCLAYLMSMSNPKVRAKIQDKYSFLISDEPIPKRFENDVQRQDKVSFSDDIGNQQKTTSIFITNAFIEKLAKACRVKVNTYSQLGKELNIPWQTFGYKQDTNLPVIVNNEHTFGMWDGKIDLVLYESPVQPRNRFTVKEYYKSITSGEYELRARVDKTPEGTIMYKAYKDTFYKTYPELTPQLSRCFSDNQCHSVIFKHKYELKPPPKDLVNIVKAAEIFPSGGKFEDVFPFHFKYDHNSSFRSPQTSPFYRGFPSHELEPSFIPSMPAFVAITLESVSPIVKKVWNMYMGPAKENFYILPMPTFDFLKEEGAKMQIHYYLNTTKFQDIDFSQYSKEVGNSLIGRSIAGGMKSLKEVKILTRDENERNHLIYEAQTENIRFAENQTEDKISPIYDLTFYVPSQDLGQLFHFHSYILAYSATQIMYKWIEVLNSGGNIIAFKSDGFITDLPEISELSTAPGMWKREKIQEFYYDLFVRNETERKPHDFTDQKLENLKISISHRKNEKISIEGDGGCGKSYQFLKDPNYKQMIVVPTVELKNAHIETIKRDNLSTPIKSIQTAHMIFQFSITDDEAWLNLLKRKVQQGKFEMPKVIVVDEAPKFTEANWELMFHRSELINALLIPIGDFKQNKNSFKSKPISREFFSNREYKTHIFSSTGHNGTQATNYSRFTPKYQEFLDKLIPTLESDRLYTEKIDYLVNALTVLPTIKLGEISTDDLETSRIIVGTHKAKFNLYELLKPKMETVLCKDTKTRTLTRLWVDDPHIFWDRKKMDDELPAGMYEPVTCTTTDQIQGSTSRVIIHLESLIFRCRLAKDIGPLYTAITRGRDFKDNIMLC